MKCQACNINLSDYESTRKDLHGKYLDLCNSCFGTIKQDILVVERSDLATQEEIEREDFIDTLEESE